MPLLTWLSLLFLIVAVTGSITVAALRALRAWRAFKRFTKTTNAAVGHVLSTAGEAEAHAIRLATGSARLSDVLAHLQASLAQLSVIQSAAADARASLFSFRGSMPRK